MRRKFNKISALKLGDHWCYDDDELRREVVCFFFSLYSLNDQSNGVFALHGYFPRIELVVLDNLAMEVTNEEIQDAMFSIGPLNPGPDGLHALFYQNQWETVGPDIITNIIANQFKLVFHLLIAQNQVSFVARRHIIDNIIVAHEIIHSMLIKKGKKS
ncbi:reverse transcriptase [Gossypium australe]|uniref:Reverse transcriptase n=1 Tax=Gossypium australe TaxID=47621 RepID=A0A5B6VC61_9ROSI|nr:reverse transcriptase [Gossypium australe]